MYISEKDTKLFDIIKKLSYDTFNTDDFKKGEIIFDLVNIYKDGGYRHKYSSFFYVISNLHKKDVSNFSNLLQNLEILSNFVNEENSGLDQNTIKGVNKLIDHLSLEAARFEDNCALNNSLANYEQELIKAKKALKETQEKTENSKSELITILSIFAAIILAFSGSLSLLGGAFSSLADSPLLKTMLICIICGIIVFNTIFCLLYVISKILRRDIFFDKSLDDSETKRTGLRLLNKRLPYLIWVNILFIAMLIVNIVIIILDKVYNFMPY